MPKLKNVEKKIWEIEGFDVKFLHRDSKDVNGRLDGIPQYNKVNAAKNNMTVGTWKDQRFFPQYPGFDVTVLDGVGGEVTGQTNLGTVRDSYAEDEE